MQRVLEKSQLSYRSFSRSALAWLIGTCKQRAEREAGRSVPTRNWVACVDQQSACEPSSPKLLLVNVLQLGVIFQHQYTELMKIKIHAGGQRKLAHSMKKRRSRRGHHLQGASAMLRRRQLPNNSFMAVTAEVEHPREHSVQEACRLFTWPPYKTCAQLLKYSHFRLAVYVATPCRAFPRPRHFS
jgi:hypothetical protein